MSGFGSSAAHGNFTRNPDLGIQRWRIRAWAMKMHQEEDEFRYQEFMHAEASDAADRDKAFALGFWDMPEQDP